jgi:hypothetical protein
MPQKGTRRTAKEKIKRVHKPFETNADCIKAIREHGGWVKRIGIYCYELMISVYYPDNITPFCVPGVEAFSKEELFGQFVFLDGTRIGIEVQE